LTGVEFDVLENRHIPESLPLRFPGTTEVANLRMYRGVFPYVAVDFGHGAVAAFDPLTMLCVYSD
jgi:hypothetical protein